MQDLQRIIDAGNYSLTKRERNREDIRESALNLVMAYGVFITNAPTQFLEENRDILFEKGNEISRICIKLSDKYWNFQEPEEEPRMNRFR